MVLSGKKIHKIGGYQKDHVSNYDTKGYRNFTVNLLKNIEGDTGSFEKNPLYINDNQNEGLKHFRGRTPKEAAKKVVTEVCRILKKDNINICKPISIKDLEEREQYLLDNLNNIANIKLTNYNGFQFELVDVLNKKSIGESRVYHYYGERVKLPEEKIFKDNKFSYESNVIPIRKHYILIQALIDHIVKSKKAQINYGKTKNFVSRHSRSKSKSKNMTKRKTMTKK